MSVYTQEIATLRHDYDKAQGVKVEIDRLYKQLEDLTTQHVTMLEAQKLLATVSDDNANAVLNYIRDIINKTLGEIFPHDPHRIYIENTLYRGQYAHINIILTNSEGKKRNIVYQNGTGMRQVISWLFVICVIIIRHGRRFMVMDELFSGLHPYAKRVIMDIMQIFAEEGFQFIMVEYGVNTVGKMFLCEKVEGVGVVNPLDGKYNNEVFLFKRPPESVDMSIFVDEENQLGE